MGWPEDGTLSDDWDEIDDVVTEVRSPLRFDPAPHFNVHAYLYSRRLALAVGEIFLVQTAGALDTSVSRRHLMKYLRGSEYEISKELTFSYFRDQVMNLGVQGVGASIAQFVDRFRGPVAPTGIDSSGWYSIQTSNQRDCLRSVQHEAKVGGSYELLVGQLIKDYEESARGR